MKIKFLALLLVLSLRIQPVIPSEAKNALKLPAYHKAELPKEKDISECMDWLYSKKLVSDKYSYQDLVVKGLF